MSRVRTYLTSRKTLGNLVVLALLAGWYLLLAPTAFGGPTAYVEVSGHSMDGTYRTGDLVITRQQDTYRKGDIVTFRVDDGQVIHRIIGGNGTVGYKLQGDNNPDPDPWRPTDDDVVGKAWIHLPQKAWVLHKPAEPVFAGTVTGVGTVLVLLLDELRAARARNRGRHRASKHEPATPTVASAPVKPGHGAAVAIPGQRRRESASIPGQRRRESASIPGQRRRELTSTR